MSIRLGCGDLSVVEPNISYSEKYSDPQQQEQHYSRLERDIIEERSFNTRQPGVSLVFRRAFNNFPGAFMGVVGRLKSEKLLIRRIRVK